MAWIRKTLLPVLPLTLGGQGLVRLVEMAKLAMAFFESMPPVPTYGA